MQFSDIRVDLAFELDKNDPLRGYRDHFVIDDPDLIYLDGNSLGRLPKKTATLLAETIQHEWGNQLIRSWNESWIDLPFRVGAKIAQLAGAHPGEITITDATSVNLFKLATAALQARPGRKKIVSDVFNFPSDLYILQGIIHLLDQGHQLVLVRSENGLTISQESLSAAIDEDTALVCLSHVAFKSAFLYDMAEVTARAHSAGALTLWDLSHSIGALPVDLHSAHADLAVGCTYKYLNGGPGSPAFLYVREDLQDILKQPIWGWFASDKPFDFSLNYAPAQGITRFQVGTPPVLQIRAIEPALDLLLAAGIDRLRAKSLLQTAYLIFLAEQWLVPLDFEIGTPKQPHHRGSHVSLRHLEGFRVCRALIESPPPAVRVIPDFREPDNIRLGVAPIYTTFIEIYRAVARLKEIMEKGIYKSFSTNRQNVT